MNFNANNNDNNMSTVDKELAEPNLHTCTIIHNYCICGPPKHYYSYLRPTHWFVSQICE